MYSVQIVYKYIYFLYNFHSNLYISVFRKPHCQKCIFCIFTLYKCTTNLYIFVYSSQNFLICKRFRFKHNHKCSVHHVKVHNDITHFSHVGCSLQVIMLSELLFYVHVVIVDNCKKKLNLFSCICFNDDFSLLSHLKAC